jgi:hypothetical protein
VRNKLLVGGLSDEEDPSEDDFLQLYATMSVNNLTRSHVQNADEPDLGTEIP